ncbi:MAG: GNAT family N-acetyltransferase [Anaerolineae bacterium]
MLTKQDVLDFRSMRLRALQEHPEAFGASYEEELAVTPETMESWLDGSMFGAFDENTLIGIVSIRGSRYHKTRHRANIGAMYVAPEARGKGVGQALMDAAVEKARSLAGVEDVVLAVTVGNDSARRLYLRAGFTPYSIDPRYLKVNDQYFDIEWMILRIAEHGR